MMTVTDNTARSMDYSNYPIPRSYSTATTNYDYLPNYPNYSHASPLFSTGSKSYYPSSMDPMSNLNQFYSQPITEPSSIYSSSNSNSNSNPFHYPPGLLFGWNNGSSLMRTPTSSYLTYPGSNSYSISQEKSRLSNPIYPSYFPPIPPTNYSLSSIQPLPPPPPPPPQPPLPSLSSTNRTVSQSSLQRSMPSKINKRPRLTAPIRREILKLKASQPTIFIWEIQQNLLQNGICTSQTLPTPAVIQRVLNESTKNSVTVKEEATKMNVNYSSVTICLSPSPSPTLSNGESHSECSICLESYRSGQEVSILACSHEYHSSCIGEWMVKNRSCPMCRKDIHNQPQFVTLLI